MEQVISNDTIYQPQPYIYNRPGTFNVKLTGIDINGCKDSLIQKVTVNPLPFLYVLPGIDTLCGGSVDSLFAFHSDSLLWSPSNGLSCATCDTVLANPSTTTQYKITATTKFGCTITDSILVKVFPPFTAVPSASDLYICPNDTVQLLVDPREKELPGPQQPAYQMPIITGQSFPLLKLPRTRPHSQIRSDVLPAVPVSLYI